MSFQIYSQLNKHRGKQGDAGMARHPGWLPRVPVCVMDTLQGGAPGTAVALKGSSGGEPAAPEHKASACTTDLGQELPASDKKTKLFSLSLSPVCMWFSSWLIRPQQPLPWVVAFPTATTHGGVQLPWTKGCSPTLTTSLTAPRHVYYKPLPSLSLRRGWNINPLHLTVEGLSEAIAAIKQSVLYHYQWSLPISPGMEQWLSKTFAAGESWRGHIQAPVHLAQVCHTCTMASLENPHGLHSPPARHAPVLDTPPSKEFNSYQLISNIRQNKVQKLFLAQQRLPLKSQGSVPSGMCQHPVPGVTVGMASPHRNSIGCLAAELHGCDLVSLFERERWKKNWHHRRKSVVKAIIWLGLKKPLEVP